jgi:hypothetical protein
LTLNGSRTIKYQDVTLRAPYNILSVVDWPYFPSFSQNFKRKEYYERMVMEMPNQGKLRETSVTPQQLFKSQIPFLLELYKQI